MFDKDGNDLGYKSNPNWWYDINDPDCFRIAKLDEDYPEHYFTVARVPDNVVEAYCKYVLQYGEQILGRRVKNIIEFGAAGGWFTKKFIEKGITIDPLDGSSAAIKSLKKIGIDADLVDIRKAYFFADWGMHPYDIALVSEILEHCEPCFHGTAVYNITCTSDLIWFSSEGPEIPNQSHKHHPGEMPLLYWQRLFEFYGYGCYMLPDHVYNETAQRGRCIFYNKGKYQL